MVNSGRANSSAFLTLFPIVVTSLFSVQPAQAYLVTLEEVGPNVVATGSGPINLTGLTPIGQFIVGLGIRGNTGKIGTSGGHWRSEMGTVDSPDARVSGAEAFSWPTLAPETLSAFSPALC